LAGIAQLLPDPWLYGGSLHSSGSGGYLIPHIDFHLGNILHYCRRLNLLLYLNDAWSEANGGALELWDKERDSVVKELWPAYGRCVIFQADTRSLHGFSKPLVGRDRNSLALYYYTATPSAEFSGDGSTHRRINSMVSKGIANDIQRAALWLCMAASYRFSKLAWFFRPD
jgi:Rps23 Pro-64 3,4-dihydroxylase Tpa1-like proline 4-hydroxylase